MVLVIPTAASPARGGHSDQLVKCLSPCAAFDITPGPGYPNWGGLSALDFHVGKGKAHTYNRALRRGHRHQGHGLTLPHP